MTVRLNMKNVPSRIGAPLVLADDDNAPAVGTGEPHSMNAVEFLRAILPSTGLIVIGTFPHKSRKHGGDVMHHEHFDLIENAAGFAISKREETNVYFWLHTTQVLVEKTSMTGRSYKAVERTAEKAAFVKCFYADLDVGGSPDKFGSRKEAISALIEFCKTTGMPKPLIVDSGRGFHVYWVFTAEVPSADWKPAAEKLKRLMGHHGLKADRAVTADAARVLRVACTFNRKDMANPIKVRVETAGASPRPFSDLVAIIDLASADLPPGGLLTASGGFLGQSEARGAPETPENVETVKGMLAAIPPDIERGVWRNALWGVAALGWGCGEELTRAWSATGEKFDEGEFGKVWGSFDPARPGGIGVGSLVRLAIEHGYGGPSLTGAGDGAGAASSTDLETPSGISSAALTAAAAGTSGDVANGRRFAAAARDRLLYIHDTGAWLRFDLDSGWLTMPAIEVEAFAKVVVRAMAAEAVEVFRANPDDPKAKRLRQNVERVSRLPGMRSMIDMAKSEPGMSGALAEFDADPWLLGVQNGVVDLRTGKLRQAAPDLRVSKRCRVEFDPAAECPRFRAFLAEVLPDPEVQAFVLRFMGYCLTGSVEAQAFLFLHGGGFNGKSVLVDLLAWLLGDYARKIPTEMLMLQQRSAQGPDPDVLLLKGLRLAYASETEDGRRLSEARIKDMTGGERMTARAPYATTAVEFTPTYKLVISGNHKPSISDTSHGMWRRVILLLFGVQIPEGDRDPDLSAKLKSEGPGILNLAIAGLRDWQAGPDLRVPASIKAATATYKAEQDVLGEFLADECEAGEGFKAPRAQINAAYGDWCISNRHKPMGANRLTKELGERGFHRDPGRRNFLGLRLRSSGPPILRSS